MAHPIENIMKSTMEELREMVDVNTIIGDPIMTGSDTVIVPVSKVSLGFVCGGGEYKAPRGRNEDISEERHPFVGASTAGMCLTPMAFLAITNGVVRVMPADYNCTIDRVIDLMPEAFRAIESVVKKACPEHTQAQQRSDLDYDE